MMDTVQNEQIRIARSLAYLVFIAGLMALGLAPSLTAAFAGLEGAGKLVVLHLAAMAFLAAFLGWMNPRAALLFLVFLLPWQPLFSMPVSEALGGPGIKLLVASKEVFSAVLLSVLFYRNAKKVKWGIVDMAALVFLCAYFLYFIKSPAGITARVVSFKEGFMIVCFYFIGRLFIFSKDDLAWMLRAVVGVSILVAAFGYLERFFFDGLSWKFLGAIDYLESKIDTSQFDSIAIDGLPHNWFTFLGTTPVRRMVGPIGDATSLSRFLAFPVLALIYLRSLTGRIDEAGFLRLSLLLFLGAALALTLGRGGQVIIIGGTLVLFLARKPVIALLLGIPFMLLVVLKLAIFDLQSGSAMRHLAGLAGGLSELFRSPLGNGLGTSGQMAVLYGVVEVKVSESYIGSLAFQTGLPGVLLYTAFFAIFSYSFAREYLRKRRTPDEWRAPLLAFSLSSGIYFTSVLANSAIAPISSGLSLIFCGALLGTIKREQI